jgi:alpha-D-ribose 1-methylphosphonate 5-triphosphate synthase subunit PhnH
MKLDFVHDVQRSYRNLLRAYAFPGTQQLLLSAAQDLNTGSGTHRTAVLLAVTLMDNEMQAYLHGADEATRLTIQQLTYTRFSRCDQADSLFFFTAGEEELRSAQTGTHIDPHRGADICVRVNELPQEVPGEKAEVTVSGPGIREPRGLAVSTFTQNAWWWLQARNYLCREYPLGVETILFDDDLRVMVFPRSTRIECVDPEGGATWHT